VFNVHIPNLNHPPLFVMIYCRLNIPITGNDILMNLSRLFLDNLTVYLFVNWLKFLYEALS